MIPNRANPHEYRTLNKNFKIKTNNQLKSKDLNTIISQESLLSNRKQVDALKSNLEANRLGSFESVLSQTVTIQSIKRKKFSKKKLKLNQLIKPALNNTATICNF